MVPGFNGAFPSPEWRDALWARFSMGAAAGLSAAIEKRRVMLFKPSEVLKTHIDGEATEGGE